MPITADERSRLRTELDAIRAAGLAKEERTIRSVQDAWIDVEYPAGAASRRVLNLCANNYLGLSSHPAVLAAAHRGLDARGYGLSSVRFICGTQDIHRTLEQRMSAFLGTEDTILFGSCLDANAAIFEAILAEADVVIADRLVHASLIDGIRLCKARQESFKHADMQHLEEKLRETQDARSRLIVTDGVFSMDGDIARLGEICALADRYRAMVLVDDSHATGFMGATGRGTHELCGVMGQVDIITTTLGKALGGASGGCVSARSEIVEMCRQRGRPYLFSNTVPPVIVSAAIEVLNLLSSTTEHRDKLARNTVHWRRMLTEAGFDLRPGEHPIVPIMLYDAKLASDMARELFDEGVYVVGFSFPVVPKGQARIRTQVSAAHELADLDRAFEAFKRVGARHGILGKKKKDILERFGS